MPFWKKSDDPWDRKPDRSRPEPREPKENPIDSLKQWNEKRKAEREKQVPPPIPCPWCGKDMETGYIMGGRGIYWGPGLPNFQTKWISTELGEGTFRVDTEGGLAAWRTAWLCRDCEKAVFDVSDAMPKVYSTEEPQETKEEEQSEE